MLVNVGEWTLENARREKIWQSVLLLQIVFVTLQDFSAFLCIKAVWGTEEKAGYELETVLNSTFCYNLHQRTPDAEPATVL